MIGATTEWRDCDLWWIECLQACMRMLQEWEYFWVCVRTHWEIIFAWSITGRKAEDSGICPAWGDPSVHWMGLRNGTIDKHAASYETSTVQLKSTLCVPAIQHKRKSIQQTKGGREKDSHRTVSVQLKEFQQCLGCKTKHNKIKVVSFWHYRERSNHSLTENGRVEGHISGMKSRISFYRLVLKSNKAVG